MPLWGKTDVLASVPTSTSTADIPAMFFVDETEAAVATNRAKGIKTPGWNKYTAYTDSNGVPRNKVEPLVVMKVSAGSAGDDGTTGVTATEDATVADV